MQGMGLVTCGKDLPLKYSITAKGQDALRQQDAAQPKKGKATA